MNNSACLQEFKEHLSGYQRRDHEIVDYQMFELEDTRLSFRGPPPDDLSDGQYFTCVGAAQTFGCFCETPFPTLLGERLNLPALNLGYGGAGPEFFERHDCLDRYINRGKFAVVQVMSGRSQSNSQFECRGLEYMTRRSDGARLSAANAYGELIAGYPAFFSSLSPFFGKIARKVWRKGIVPRWIAAPKVRRIVRETREAWLESYKRLFARINVPIILFWFSKREPAYLESGKDVYSLFGEFPHLVNAEMIQELRKSCECYVECVTRRGSPQRLVSRFTGAPATVSTALDRVDFAGRPWTHNEYYPSPEMHQDGANAILAAYDGIACR